MATGTRIQIKGNGAGTNIINTMFLMEEIQSGLWPALADKVRLQWCGKFNNIVNGLPYKWTGCEISWIASTGPTPQSFAWNVSGGLSGLLPMQVAFVVKLMTGFSGRSMNGRWYISGLSPVVNTDGFPNSTAMSNMATALAGIKSQWGISVGGTNTLAVYSRKKNNLFPVADLAATPVWATIRSRRFGVGI